MAKMPEVTVAQMTVVVNIIQGDAEQALAILASLKEHPEVLATAISKMELELPQLPPGLQADGFQSPVGDASSLGPDGLWMAQVERGRWFDANPYSNRYTDSAGNPAYHTGADLNWNPPGQWDKDKGQPVLAAASGVVHFAGRVSFAWGNVVIIWHDPLPDGKVYVSRSAHLATLQVKQGDTVRRGQQIGTVGAPGGGPNHLHFDLSPSNALLADPGDWPGLAKDRLLRDYDAPRAVIEAHQA